MSAKNNGKSWDCIEASIKLIYCAMARGQVTIKDNQEQDFWKKN